MAKFLKTRSRYLTLMSLKWVLIALLMLIIVIDITFLSPLINQATNGNMLAQWIALGVGIIIPIAFIGLAKHFERRSDNFFLGDDGELEVERILKQLPDEYLIIADLLKPSGGNIDFVVVGPTGIFALEVKKWSRSNRISFDGTDLTFNGKHWKNNPLKQARGNAIELGLYLRKKLNEHHIFVNSLVVFASRQNVHFGLKEVGKGAYVICKEFLLELLTAKGKTELSATEREKI